MSQLIWLNDIINFPLHYEGKWEYPHQARSTILLMKKIGSQGVYEDWLAKNQYFCATFSDLSQTIQYLLIKKIQNFLNAVNFL